MKGNYPSTSLLAPGQSLSYGATILLSQSLPGKGTKTVANNDNQDLVASLSGQHLSQKHELLNIQPVIPMGTNADAPGNATATTSQSIATESHKLKNIICFNDTVSFQHEGKFMGVRGDKVGFYRSFRGQAEQWIILNPNPAISTATINLNHEHDDVNNATTTTMDKTKVRIPIQTGLPILLQNELTGHLLSSARSTSGSIPSLLNFQSTMNVTASVSTSTDNDDDTDINFAMDMHAGIRLTFSGREKWSLDAVHTPPMPNPRYATRTFMTGEYLMLPHRHEVSLGDSPFDEVQKKAPVKLAGWNEQRLGYCSINVQDCVLVEEVLGALVGLEGEYVKYVNNRFILGGKKERSHQEFQNFDGNVVTLVEKILPTATDFVAINTFVSTRQGKYDHGRVSHALCGAIDTLLQDYMDFVTVLDDYFRMTDGTTLSWLWGNMQTSVRTLSILNKVVMISHDLKGGALLNALEDTRQLYLGDENARILFGFLLEKASLPYMEMLRGWLQDGTLKDPFAEFMIEESGRMKRQDFCYNIGDGSVDQWAQWYSMRNDHVLNMMKTNNGKATENFALKILTTGKYWNATILCEHRDVRAARVPRSQRDVKEVYQLSALSYGISAAEMARCVDKEYQLASRTFLNIFMRDYRTLDVLAFMKRYFLLDQGDFFVHFLDMAEEELLREMTDVSRGRVQNWMALSIHMSGGPGSEEGEMLSTSPSSSREGAMDIFSSLTGAFATESLISHLDALHAMSGGIGNNEPKTPSRHVYGGANKGLTGVEAFMLDFHIVPFPLSLILSRHAIANYQLMFRHLFFAKHVERRLVGTWLDHQVIKEYQSLRKDLGKTYFLRQRMLHFMQNFVYYMMFEVIEPNYLQMEARLLSEEGGDIDSEVISTKQKTVDDILSEHNHFLQKTLSECLLSNRDLVRTLTKLMTTCLLFSDQMKLFIEQTEIEVEQNKIATESRQKRNRKMFESVDSSSVKREKRMNERMAAQKEQRRIQKQKQIDKLERELNSDSYRRMIARFEQVFNSNLSEFMMQLMSDSNSHAHNHLANLCVRLDYNGYVTHSMKN